MQGKKRRLQYSTQDLEKAVAAIEAGMPFKTASKKYGIPRTTLQDKVKGKSPMGRKSGPETVLKKEEEMVLENWLIHIAKCGFPGTKTQLLDSVQILVKNLERSNNFTDGRPGRRWYEGFMTRHPNLSKRMSQNLTSARANLTENRIRQWFKEVETYLNSTNNFEILLDPNRVFNCDETAFFLSPKGDKVLVRKGDKTVYSFISNDEKECLTTLIMCNAAGRIPPPMIVYKYKRIPKSIADKVPNDWGIGRSENGWMTGETFFEYIANIFHPWLVAKGVKFPVILFLDGHTSHLTLALSEFCSTNNIILVALCPNATHILQPLDVAVFRPLKMEWKKSIHCWRMENNGQKLSRDVFATILQTTFEKMTKIPDVIKNGFQACGLVPFNVDNIRFSKYFKIPTKSNTSEDIEHVARGNPNESLRFLESEIAEETLVMFKSSGTNWEGPVEDKSLFLLWSRIKSYVEKAISPVTVIENTQTTFSDTEPEETQQRTDTPELEITGMLNLDNFTFPIQVDVHGESFNVPDVKMDNKNITDGEKQQEIRSECNSTEAINMIPIVLDETKTKPSTPTENVFLTLSSNFLPSTPPEQIMATTSTISTLRNPPRNVIRTADNESVLSNNSINDEVSTTMPTPFEDIVSAVSNNIVPSTPPEKIIRTLSTTSTTRNTFRNTVLTADKENDSHNNSINPGVPTPFKKSLFWPEPKNVETKKKLRAKLPAVATSSQWQHYFKSKEEKKRQEGERKMQKQEERKRKQSELGKSKKAKTGDILPDTNNTNPIIESDCDDYRLNDFVIAMYNDQYYPGKIIATKDSDSGCRQYEVTHMEKKGINWSWPEKLDVLLYDKAEIVKKIAEPISKSKRGLFTINEISEFQT